MDEGILASIDRKIGVEGISALLADGLSGSELSSLLLDVYRRKTAKMTAAELLAQYRQNRLVQPSDVEMIGLLETQVLTLRFFRERGFLPVELPPVAVMGTCSVIAAVNQDKVLSAIRNTEVVADATNSLALHAANTRRLGDRGEVLRFCTAHRHVRTQPFADKRFLPHFVIGCMVSAGRDRGSLAFECSELADHVAAYVGLLREGFGVMSFRLVLRQRMGYDGRALMDAAEEGLRRRVEGMPIGREEAAGHEYYTGVQFKLYIEVGGVEMEIADGGLVDWTQRLLGDRKERFLISGFGLELLYKMQRGLL